MQINQETERLNGGVFGAINDLAVVTVSAKKRAVFVLHFHQPITVATTEGEPFPGDPRGVLKKVIARAAKLGYTMNAGMEAEFFMFKPRPDMRLVECHHSDMLGRSRHLWIRTYCNMTPSGLLPEPPTRSSKSTLANWQVLVALQSLKFTIRNESRPLNVAPVIQA